MRENFTARIEALRELMKRLGRLHASGGNPPEAFIAVCVDSIGWEDIYYLTGFRGSSSAFLITEGDALLFVDPRYSETARDVDACRVVSCLDVRRQSPLQAALAHLSSVKLSKLAYGGSAFGHVAYRIIESAVGESVERVDLSNLLLSMRRRKSANEVRCIRRAAGIASAAYGETLARAHVGMTEREFAAMLRYRMSLHGCDFAGEIPIMLASGERTSLPHAMPTERKLSPGDLVVVDFTARYEGYLCDITRMFNVGEPSDDTRSLHSIMLWAQVEAASRIKPGVNASEVDAAARAVVTGAGLGEGFIHGVGHGVGLCVHEPPSMNASSSAVLSEGDVVTVEPGFYAAGSGGMRIEDDYLVTRDGAECLTEVLSRNLYTVAVR